MIQPRCSGIVFSRLPDEPDADALVVSATEGVATGITAGDQSAATWVVTSGRVSGAGSLLSQGEVEALVEAARRLEWHFGMPQDIEWVIDGGGRLRILQARPMAVSPDTEVHEALVEDRTPVLEGGYVASPGFGSGPVFVLESDEDIAHFPAGGVLVARHSAPSYAQVMDRCAAIVTEVGSPTGHMSSLAREFRVPAIVGLDGATRALGSGRMVTVDASSCRVFDGIIQYLAPQLQTQVHDSPALERLRCIARLVTPLTMIDPASPDFNPGSCQSLHDITRYVHEKAFEVMFHYGDIASADAEGAVRLDAKLPIRVEVFDVGGGLVEGSALSGRICREDVLSTPMQAFLEGLLDTRIRWDLPRPVSMRGFLSVLGESMAGPPAGAGEIGRISYAVISDRYMNFSSKAGYHFSTVDTYCGRSLTKNYIHFRFNGGGADAGRRHRRVRFLSNVVGAMDFKVQLRDETLVARLDKYKADEIRSRLISLGRLTLCARQLDMLMDNESSPELFAQYFLAGEWHRF